MKTDDLIVRLARSAGPVRPLPPPPVRLARWMAVAAGVAALVVAVIGPRRDLMSVLSRPSFVASLVCLVLATICGAAAAFALSVPGERSKIARGLAIAAALGWPAVWLVSTLRAGTAGAQGLFHALCAIEIAGIALITGVALVAMLRRALPLQPGWTAAIASLGAVSLGGVAAQLVCPLDDPAHQLVGHALVGAVVALTGLLAGRRLLKPMHHTSEPVP